MRFISKNKQAIFCKSIKVLTSKNNLNHHVEKVHGLRITIKYESGSINFDPNSIQHEKVTKQKIFKCDYCLFKFTQNFNLNKHLKKMHKVMEKNPHIVSYKGMLRTIEDEIQCVSD